MTVENNRFMREARADLARLRQALLIAKADLVRCRDDVAKAKAALHNIQLLEKLGRLKK